MKTGTRLKLTLCALRYALCVIALMAVIILALMHGIVSEVELRELKADRMAYNTILTDRALLERQLAREWSR